MPRSFISKVIILLTAAAVFAMYQETPAQKKRPKTSKTPAVQVKAAPPDIAFTVSMSKPATHLLEVEMRVKWQQMPAQLQLKMPVWTPGSYLVREFARHVQDFAVRDSAGTDLAWQKLDKNTWAVDTRSAKDIVVNYRVYANELTVRTNELNDEHAFWNNAALLLFVKDQLAAPSTVRVQPFGNWRVATGLPPVEGQPNTFRAANFDILYDSPFEVSDFKEKVFDVRGKKHRYVVTGEGNYNLDRIAADTAKIVEECYKIFGELPYDDYTFILNLRGGGGLEHLNSTALQTNRWTFANEARYKSFLGLVAHEYFHVFNVKRIRPDALGPFDYERENYTKLLWVAEGGTAYYEGVLLVRAGLISDREFLNNKAAQIKALQERPGRFETSVEEASFDAWIKYYRQDENSVNNQVSYYDKGEVVSFLLDVAIRTASGGTRSLDDVLRSLYEEQFKKGKNYTPEEFQRAAETAAGKSLDDFFSKYVRGRAEIDYNAILNPIGLQLAVNDVDPNEAYLGVDLADDGGRLTVRTLPAGTPAYNQGLNTGDQIVAIDGFRADQAFLRTYIRERKPGDTLKFTVFRFDKLREIPVTLGNNPRKEYGIIPVPEPTDEQRQLYGNYLNGDL